MKKIIIILGVLGASFSAIFVRFSTVSSDILAFYRMFLAAAGLFFYIWSKKDKELLSVNKKYLLLSSLSGIMLAFHFFCYFESLKFTSIASSVVLVDTEVIFVALFSYLFIREKIGKTGILGILIAFCGSIIIAFVDNGSEMSSFYGDILALSGAVFVALYTLIGKYVRPYINTINYTFIVYLSAAITLFFKICFSNNIVTLVNIDIQNFMCALGLTVFCTFLGHSIFSWGLKYENASFISMAKLLEPVFSSILGIMIFNEIPGVIIIIGAAFVISGIVIYNKKQIRINNSKNS